MYYENGMNEEFLLSLLFQLTKTHGSKRPDLFMLRELLKKYFVVHV